MHGTTRCALARSDIARARWNQQATTEAVLASAILLGAVRSGSEGQEAREGTLTMAKRD